jgi:hypothetical protein
MTNSHPELALESLKTKDRDLLVYFESIEITNRDQPKNCEDLLILGRRAVKAAEDTQKELLQPIKEEEKMVRDLFRPYLSRWELALSRVSSALNNWHAKERKAAEELRIEQMKAQAAAIAEARETGEIIQLPNTTPMVVNKTSHAHVGTVTYRKDFDIQVVSPELVPRDLCEPSLVRIRARVKSGVIDIPGVLITEKTITVARGG